MKRVPTPLSLANVNLQPRFCQKQMWCGSMAINLTLFHRTMHVSQGSYSHAPVRKINLGVFVCSPTAVSTCARPAVRPMRIAVPRFVGEEGMLFSRDSHLKLQQYRSPTSGCRTPANLGASSLVYIPGGACLPLRAMIRHAGTTTEYVERGGPLCHPESDV